MKRSYRRLTPPLLIFAIGTIIGACSGASEEEALLGIARSRVVPDGDGGYCTGDSGWDGNYDICTNNCHNAANYGVQGGNDGIVSCDGCPNGTLGGHTVNYDSVPCAAGSGASCQGYCVSDPQSGDSTPACCWDQANGGPVDIAAGPGAACAAQVCGNDGGATALDAGEQWDGAALDCSGHQPDQQSCETCCDHNWEHQADWWCFGEPNEQECLDQVNAAWRACSDACATSYP